MHWKEGNGAFNELEYSNFYRDITVDQLLKCFWNLLKEIADSGEIKVTEGFWIRNQGISDTKPRLICDLVINADSARNIKIDDVYEYPYNKELKSYSWNEIKDMFYEMSLDQLRLTIPNKLHRHTKKDDILLQACFDWDIEQIRLALKNGANVNCLNESGESPLQMAVEFFKSHNISNNIKYSEEEILAIEAINEKKCKEVVELLLDNGADINLFGYSGLTPLVCAYDERSPQMIRFLLDKGANPNVNCYLEDYQYWPRLKNVRSTILESINDLLYEDYNESEKQIERLIRTAGGRQFVWDFTPWDNKNIGKYVVIMSPSKSDTHIFSDNSQWWIGTDSSLAIEDESGHSERIDLTSISGLAGWCQEYREHHNNASYGWDTWNNRGIELARQIAALIPDSVGLFYMSAVSPECKYIRIK